MNTLHVAHGTFMEGKDRLHIAKYLAVLLWCDEIQAKQGVIEDLSKLSVCVCVCVHCITIWASWNNTIC